VRHARLVIHRIHLDGTEVPIRFATLVAVERAADGASLTPNTGSAEVPGDIDWEVVADGVADYEGAMERHRVEALCITGADDDGHLILTELTGDAVVVRYVERTVVLRGDGPLQGFTPEMFQA